MPTIPVKLSVVNNKIQVDPDSCRVNSGDSISFYTNDDNTKFEVALHNPDDYFVNIPRVFNDDVVDSTPLVIEVDDPDEDHNVKYYSVCVLDVDQQPLPPDAPPRIIVRI